MVIWWKFYENWTVLIYVRTAFTAMHLAHFNSISTFIISENSDVRLKRTCMWWNKRVRVKSTFMFITSTNELVVPKAPCRSDLFVRCVMVWCIWDDFALVVHLFKEPHHHQEKSSCVAILKYRLLLFLSRKYIYAIVWRQFTLMII